MDKDFLLASEPAKVLYHEHAAKMPIIDYHCHINPNQIADDKKFDSITEVWLGGDHYKWRAMRSCGVQEELITGSADPEDKFIAWANTVPKLIGNPLYHWTHLELQRYFNIYEPLTGRNAKEVYKACNEILARDDMSVRGIIDRSNVKLICTTDDPIDDLAPHARIAADPTCKVKVLPAFRPDKAARADKATFPGYIAKLEEVTGIRINTIDDLRAAIMARIKYFDERGCRVSDHALDTAICRVCDDAELNETIRKGKAGEYVTPAESEGLQTAMLLTYAKEFKRLNWVMQWHFNCLRDASGNMFAKLGPDTGFDAINDGGNTAARLIAMLDLLEKNDALPKTVLYSLNPADNVIIGTVMGAFQHNSDVPGRIQMGSAWWFNDHKPGMEKQMTDLMDLGAISTFVGMLTDSRSFLSYTRHEYFRRILCNLLGGFVENGEYPADYETLGKIIEDISYNNTLHYFRFDEVIK